MIEQTVQIRGENVTVRVNLDTDPIDVQVSVLGVTWGLNRVEAVRLGAAFMWGARIDGALWIVWASKRPAGNVRPWRWLVAPDVFGAGTPLEGEFYAQEALTVATREIKFGMSAGDRHT